MTAPVREAGTPPRHDGSGASQGLIEPGGVPDPGRARPPRPAAGPGVRLLSTALGILAAVLLGFVGNAWLIGDLRHARDRQVDYADLRTALANGVAPIGRSAGGGIAPEPGVPVAILEIPRLKLREVVREGTTAEHLARGPGHRRDTPLPGQAGVSVVMGRQATYGGPFGRLGELSTGDELTVTTGQGRHTYRVLGPRRAGDLQPPPVRAGKGRLTLTTADGTPFMPTGILRVDAELVSAVQATPASAVPPGALPAEEAAMASQETAWLPLVLWGQALELAAAGLAWAHARWGRPHSWVVGVPLVVALGLFVADQAALLLPNLL
ncbi:sortase [Streptomyces sp. NPDC002309]